MKPLIYKGFSVFEKSFVFGVYGAYLKNRMNHTSHFNISAKNRLKLKFFFVAPEIPRFYPSFLLYAPYLACLLRIYPHL